MLGLRCWVGFSLVAVLRLLIAVASLVVPGLQSTGSIVVVNRFSCSLRMWDPRGLEMEPVSPALAGKFFTPGPPGKPSVSLSETGPSVHGVGWQPMTPTTNKQFRLWSGLTSKLFPLYHSENITLLLIHRQILTYVPSQKKTREPWRSRGLKQVGFRWEVPTGSCEGEGEKGMDHWGCKCGSVWGEKVQCCSICGVLTVEQSKQPTYGNIYNAKLFFKWSERCLLQFSLLWQKTKVNVNIPN